MKKLFLLSVCFGLSCLAMVTAQKTVSGTIVDNEGITLIGVNVLEEGTFNGAITDLDGMYTLTVAGDESVLVISYTGLQSVTEVVGS